jgi:hypothetical protein
MMLNDKLISFLIIIIFILAGCSPKNDSIEEKNIRAGNNGDLSFENIHFTSVSGGLPTGGDYNFVAAGDVNNDGYPDIAAASGGWEKVVTTGLHLFLNNTRGGWTKAGTGLPETGTYSCVRLTDINRDGSLDLLASHDEHAKSPEEGIVIFLGDGRGNWRPGTSPYPEGYASEFIVYDVNNDTIPDILAATQGEGIKAWLGDEDGSWTEISTGLPVREQYTGISPGDINADGFPDIAAATYSEGGGGSGIHLFQGTREHIWLDRSSTLSASSIKNGGRAAMGVSLLDFDQDGFLDLLINTINRGILAYRGNGNFEWELFKDGLPRRGSFIMSDFKDINNDGMIDCIAGTNGSGILLLSWDNNRWNYMAQSGLPGKGRLYTPAWIDINNDGRMDIVCATIKTGIRAWISE